MVGGGNVMTDEMRERCNATPTHDFDVLAVPPY